MAEMTVVMPQLGESVHEGVIARWLVRPGDAVEEFSPLVEVETDKVTAEVPSPVTGVLQDLLVTEGTTVETGKPIAVISADAPVPQPRAGAPAPALAPAPAPVAETHASRQRSPRPAHRRAGRAVRDLAAQAGVDLGDIAGSGAGGRISLADVRAAAARAGARRPQPGRSASPSTSGHALADPALWVREQVSISKRTIPHAWQTQQVDMSAVLEHRRRQAPALAATGARLGFAAYAVFVTAQVLREMPSLNASLRADSILRHGRIDIAVLVAVGRGAVAPVLRHADQRSLAEAARELTVLVDRARAGSLRQEEVEGATFTVNNLGVFESWASYSPVVPGQTALLTLDAVVERPVAIQGAVAIRPVMNLSLSLDHRLIDGLVAGRFLAAMKQRLESMDPDQA